MNKLREALKRIASALAPKINRVLAAKMAQRKLLGKVIEGSSTYRQLCPKGAGFGPKLHTMEQRTFIGGRRFARTQRRFVKALAYTPWGRSVAS